SSRRRHTRLVSDWSSDVCSSDLPAAVDWLAPVDARQEERFVNALAVAYGDVHQRIEQRFGKQVRLEPEDGQLGVLGIVIVLFGLDARVRQVLDFDLER